MKHIWIPKSEMKVTVTQKGDVTMWEEMTMTLQPIQKESGFKDKISTEKQKHP